MQTDPYAMLRQELADHIDECNRRFNDGEEKFDELIRCTRANTEAVNKLVQETSEVVQLYKDMQGVIRIGVLAQKFGLWIIKWPLIGAGLIAIWKWVVANWG